MKIFVKIITQNKYFLNFTKIDSDYLLKLRFLVNKNTMKDLMFLLQKKKK